MNIEILLSNINIVVWKELVCGRGRVLPLARNTRLLPPAAHLHACYCTHMHEQVLCNIAARAHLYFRANSLSGTVQHFTGNTCPLPLAPEVKFVPAVTAGGSVNFCHGCRFLHFHSFFCVFITKTVEIRWNWWCKIFGLKVRRCKILDKFHVCIY